MNREHKISVINYKIEKFSDETLEKLEDFLYLLDEEDILKGLSFQFGRKYSTQVKYLTTTPRIGSYPFLYQSYLKRGEIEDAIRAMIYGEENKQFSRTTRWRILKTLEKKHPNIREIYRKIKHENKKKEERQRQLEINHQKQLGVWEFLANQTGD